MFHVDGQAAISFITSQNLILRLGKIFTIHSRHEIKLVPVFSIFKGSLCFSIVKKRGKKSNLGKMNITQLTFHLLFSIFRHLFLGQMLLLGLLLGSSVGFAYSVEPNEFSCAAIRLGTGLAYGLIYSSLLVKLVFLISLNTGVYLPASYQALLFLFCIIVQVVIGIQW